MSTSDSATARDRVAGLRSKWAGLGTFQKALLVVAFLLVLGLIFGGGDDEQEPRQAAETPTPTANATSETTSEDEASESFTPSPTTRQEQPSPTPTPASETEPEPEPEVAEAESGVTVEDVEEALHAGFGRTPEEGMPCDAVNAPQSWTCAYDGVRLSGTTVYLELLTPGDIDPQGVADSALGLAPSTLNDLDVDTLVVYVNGLDRGSTSID